MVEELSQGVEVLPRLDLLVVEQVATNVAHAVTLSVRRRQIARLTHHAWPCAAPSAPPAHVPRHHDGRGRHPGERERLIAANADGGFDTDHATASCAR